jgi:hypothetical protein
VRQCLKQIIGSFAYPELVIEEITADDEGVTTRWVFYGNQGTVRVALRGSIVDRIQDGKIVESRLNYDPAELQRQITS